MFRNALRRFGTTAAARSSVPKLLQTPSSIAVGWDSAVTSRFHNFWLRDHCRCAQCFHPVTKQRLFNTFEIPRNVTPLLAEATQDGLKLAWSDEELHVSTFPWAWLQQHSYDPPLKKLPGTERILWGAKIHAGPPTVPYDQVMSSDEGLYTWLLNIAKFGFSFVSGVPATPEATEELSTRIAFIRETHYGKFWDFTSDLARGDTAYTTLALGAHTDNTYFTDPCGLQLFHLLSHTNGSGGATLLVDGFHAASVLKEVNPDAYELLSTIPVKSHAAGDARFLFTPDPPSGNPVLKHDPHTKELYQVRWNNDDRSVLNHIPPDLVDKYYDALRAWYETITSPDSEYWVQLQPGTAVVIDNHRVMHGRSAFDGKRRMCGAYIGADEYRSKLAVLSEKFNPDPVVKAAGADSIVGGRSIWHPSL